MSEDTVDYFDEEDAEEQREISRWESIKKQLEERCAKANIDIAQEDEDYIGSGLTLEFPNGKRKRQLHISSIRRAEQLLDIRFENVTYLGDYLAVHSRDDCVIESSVRGLQISAPITLARYLFGLSPREHPANLSLIEPIEIEGDEFTNLRIIFKFGTTFSPLFHELRPGRTLVLRIEGCTVERHDAALNLLEKIANPLFFTIDSSTGVPLSLARERKRSGGLRRLRPLDDPIEFPKYEYDPAPMSLYWYGRGASGMPLLQYLAFYQVIEFYFPTYSTSGAARRLRSVLKDPNFRADRDADIGRLLSVIGTSKGGGFGSERGQLRVTLQECLDPKSLRDFFANDEMREEFFLEKKNNLTQVRLPLKDKEADLRNSVADLLYEIRCKIVHTKGQDGEEDVGLLLPFSPEADMLANYIDLIQYTAEQVLITSSTPLKLPHSAASV